MPDSNSDLLRYYRAEIKFQSELPGIRAAYIVIEQWHRRQFDLLQRDPSLEGYYLTSASNPLLGERDLAPETRLQQGTIFAKHTPWIFIAVWSYFGLLPIALYFLA